MPVIVLKGLGATSLRAARSRNTGPLTNTVTKSFQRLWRDAARVFVLTTAEAMAVDTGMSVASLRPLAARLRIKNILVAQFSGFGPKLYGYNYEGKRSKGGNDLGASHEGATGNRSMRRGEQMGRKAYRINFGSKNRLFMTFDFQAVVYQHILWDIRRWDSIGKGRDAMVDFLNQNISNSKYDVTPLIVSWFGGGAIVEIVD